MALTSGTTTATTTVATTVAETTATLPATAAPTTTLAYVEGSGTSLVSWGARFTVIDQGVPPVDPAVLASLNASRADKRPCPSRDPITLTAQRRPAGDPIGELAPESATSSGETVALSGGGTLVTGAWANGLAEPANLSFVAPDGTATLLTDYQNSARNPSRTRLLVVGLRPAMSGRVHATLRQLRPVRGGTAVWSTELVIDPRTRTISATATAPGSLLFDEDLAGNPVVGVQRVGRIDWRHQDASPMVAPSCEPTPAAAP
jgi:hypothetical protein